MPRLQKPFFTFCSLFFLLLQTVGCDDTTDDPNPSAESNGASVTQVDVDTAALAAFDEGVTSVDITSDNQGAFEDGVESVDITSDNQSVYDEGFTAGVESVDITSDNQGAFEDGVESVDITSDNQGVYDEGFTAGVDSVDITSDNQGVYDDGFTAGAGSIDITSDNQGVYDDGFTAGAGSIDITSDNQGVYDEGFTAGAGSIDITSDNQGVYDEGFTAGVDSVDITSNDEAMCEDIGGTYVTCDYPTGNADDPDFDAGFGPCSTYAPGEINEAFCNEDVDEFGVLAAEACPTSCQVVEPGPQAECELLDEPYCSIEPVLQEGYSSGYSVGYDQGVASVPVPLPTHGECFTMGLCGSQGFKKGKYKDYTSTDAANAAGSYCSDAYNDGKKCKNVSGACTTMNGKSNYCVD